MKTAAKIFVIITLAISYSCTKDVDNLKFPEYKQKLVISGFLSPDEQMHYISVGYNQILYAGPHESYDFGKISGTLSDGDNEISLRPIFYKYNFQVGDSVFKGFSFTSSELSIDEGKTYLLKVDNGNGLYIESSCTVPFKKNLFPALDTVRIHPYSNYPEYSCLQADFSFTDIAGEENYYSLLCEEVIYPSQKMPDRLETINLVNPKYSYFNDKGIDGKRLKIHLNDITRFGSRNDSAVLKLYILNTDKPYYDYHRSVMNYVSGEIPFTEASPVYSNIKGGLGIFAAYAYDSIIVKLK